MVTVSRGDCQVGDTNVESNNVTETSKYTYILCKCIRYCIVRTILDQMSHFLYIHA